MKKKFVFRKTRLLVRLALFIALPTLLIISSCNEGTPHGGGNGSKSDLTLNCVTLTKAQVQNWLDSGWAKDSQTSIKKILLQFYSGKPSAVTNDLQLVAYPGQSLNNVKINGKTIMAIDTTCTAFKITGPVIISNNEVPLDRLKIFNKDGTLNDFDYIRFIPENFPKNPEYINYKIEIVRKSGVEAVEGDGTWPCPPYCDEY